MFMSQSCLHLAFAVEGCCQGTSLAAFPAAQLKLCPVLQIAVEGCCHGELDAIYSTLQRLERREQRKIDLLICCGDFQVCLSSRGRTCTEKVGAFSSPILSKRR